MPDVLRCAHTVTIAVHLLLATAIASDPDDGDAEQAGPTMLLVLGAPGTDEYARTFGEWAGRWESAAAEGGTSVTVIGRVSQETPDRDLLKSAIAAERDESARSLWIVMIGHGTFDGRRAKFNLRGTDVAAEDLAEWLSGFKRPLAVINCASASAPFIDRLSGPDRVIVTATKAGGEVNFARFGGYLSQAISDQSADLDKDTQVSLLEAFLLASRQTQGYYDGQRQLATEHALLDDNGDARGVRADFFSGIRPTKKADRGETLDGHRAHQWQLIPSDDERRLPSELRRRRDEIELQLAELRDQRGDLADDEYFARIETLLVEIARLYESVEESLSESDPPSDEVEP